MTLMCTGPELCLSIIDAIKNMTWAAGLLMNCLQKQQLSTKSPWCVRAPMTAWS